MGMLPCEMRSGYSRKNPWLLLPVSSSLIDDEQTLIASFVSHEGQINTGDKRLRDGGGEPGGLSEMTDQCVVICSNWKDSVFKREIKERRKKEQDQSS